MNHEHLAKAYQQFFDKSEAGKHFMSVLEGMIADAHREAEDKPDYSRDHVQRAKGARQIFDHIVSVGVEIKKGRR